MRRRRPLIDRLKVPALLAAFIALSEWADPFPWYATLPAKLAVALLVFFLARELHLVAVEVEPGWERRAQTLSARLRSVAGRVSTQTWVRLQRLAVWTAAFLLFGAVVNALTDRCDSAVQCGVLAPRLAAENLPFFLQMAVVMAFGLAELALLFWAMIKVGAWKVVYPGTLQVSFDDVWGQDEAKTKVLEQVRLLEDSQAVEQAGGYMPKGLLLYGPPGTGKTYLAKAAASYSSKPLLLVPPGAFQSTFVGINLLKVWMLFRQVRILARRWGGVIVFLDEIDSLGSRRGEVVQASPPPAPGCVPFTRPPPADPDPPAEPRRVVVGSAQMGTLEAFLAAMDGMEEPRGLLNRLLVFCGFRPLRPYPYRYLMIGATNMPERLDPALLRAGRFSRKIHVGYPTEAGRRRTYEGYLGQVRHTLTPEQVAWAAKAHHRGTGAEIRDMVNEAVLISFREGREGIITLDDLMRAMLWVRFGEADPMWQREEARWLVAVHEAGHAVAFHHLLRHRVQIWFATIEPRRGTGGMVVPTALHEDWLQTRDELLAEIQVSLASRVAEELVCGTTTNGNGGDARHASELAVQMVTSGLADSVGWHCPVRNSRWAREEAERILADCLARCRTLLAPHAEDIQALAKLLLARGTVPGDEVHALLEGSR